MTESNASGSARGTAKKAPASAGQQIVFENDIVGIGLLKNGFVVQVNRQLAAVFGYEPHEMIGMAARSLYASDDTYEARQAQADQELAQRGSFSSEAQFRRNDGSLLWGNCALTAVDRNDPSKGIIWVVQDVSERKQTEQALRAGESALRLITDNTPAIISYLDKDLRYRYINKRYTEVFGLRAEDVLGRRLQEIVGDASFRLIKGHFEKVLKGSPVTYQRPQQLPDGKIRHFEIKLVPHIAEPGKILGCYAMTLDISERKRLEETRAWLAAIVENADDAIISRTLDGTILSWNDAAERLLGYSATEAIGRPITIVMPRGDSSDLENNSRTLLGGGQVPPTEVMRLAKDGRLIEVLRSVSPIKNEAGAVTGAAIIMRDISESKRAARELQRKADLAQLQAALARAANEAATPEEALQACVARICEYGNWVIGRVGTFAPGQPKGVPQSSIWHCSQPARFEEFIDISNRFDYGMLSGRFVSIALREKRPVWVPDITADPSRGRFTITAKFGIRAGFVFPVVIANEAQAFLEFFADAPRPPDTVFLEAIGTIASHLARVIERKRAEETHSQLAAIVESSSEAIISRALDCTILTWNKSAERLFGYSAAEAIGSNINMLIPPDRVAEAQRNLVFLHQGRALSPYETVRLTRDGRRVDVSIGAAPIRDDAGNVARVALIFRDITERKRAETQLRLAASVFDSAAEGIMITDKNNDIVSVNYAFTEITGYPAAEVIGKNPRLLSSNWQTAAFYEGLWTAIKETGRWHGEIWDRRKNGEIYCELLSISAVRDKQGEITHHCAIFMDITQRKMAEAGLRRLNADLEDRVEQRTAELERANKELEAFSYSVSHDLRAPLRAIRGFSMIVLEENKTRLDADSVKHLQRILAGGERMERLIDDLLALSHVSRHEMCRQDIDLTGLAHQVIDSLVRAHPGRDARVMVRPGIRVSGDPGLIRIVMENLIGNAWKFTSRTSAAKIEVGVDARPDETIYFVRDNGTGFDMKYADKLFAPFERLHGSKEFEGTGIGLSIVGRIITRHGGRVWAESAEGQGATLFFTLGQGSAPGSPDVRI